VYQKHLRDSLLSLREENSTPAEKPKKKKKKKSMKKSTGRDSFK
jgi:hypothetical protein